MYTNKRKPRLIIFNIPLFVATLAFFMVLACGITAGVTYVATVNSDSVMAKSEHIRIVEVKDSEIFKLTSEIKTIQYKHAKEIKTLSDKVATYKKKYDTLEKNINYIASKYSYYFKDKAARSTVTVEQLMQIDRIGKEKNINPHVVMALMYRESTWNTKSEDMSGNSTSKGYGQFLASTGKVVYKKMLQRGGEYNHRKMATDPTTSIDMIYAYLEYLYRDSKDMRQALVRYNGSYRKEAYAESVNSYMIENGLGSVKSPTYR